MGWMELLVVGVVALIVVGPKDLPVMFQALGRITAKVKRMAREFQMAMADAAKASGTSDISKDLKGLASPKSLGLDSLTSAADSFERWDPMASKAPRSKFGKKADSGPLSAERAEQARLIRERTAKTAQDRLDGEAAEVAEGTSVDVAEPSERTTSSASGEVAASVEGSSSTPRQPNDGENSMATIEVADQSRSGEPPNRNVTESGSGSECPDRSPVSGLGERSGA